MNECMCVYMRACIYIVLKHQKIEMKKNRNRKTHRQGKTVGRKGKNLNMAQAICERTGGGGCVFACYVLTRAINRIPTIC